MKVWNADDPVAHSPSSRPGRCRSVAIAWSSPGSPVKALQCRRDLYVEAERHLLRFDMIGRDDCQPRAITFTSYPRRRSS